MIPELGHLALILAFLLAIVQGTLPIVGAARRIPAWMALARPVAQRAVPVHRGGLGVPRILVHHQRFLGAERRHQLELAAAAPLPFRRDVGLARRLDDAVGVDALVLDARRLAQEPAPARRDGRPRDRRDGSRQRRASCCSCSTTSNPFERAVSRSGRRPRPESAAAGPGHGHASADALHGLRRLLGRVRVRDRARCSAAASTRHGRAGRARGRRSPGASSRSAS